ncbi:hypothetical protein GL263_27065 [Streptomyces durbertensis]|uniref:ANTAR domain-containing protein n=1 Tax=Streptomyces durbertensis TaxID=2448886 RepID=A0ABR6EPB5_9ACTN|nr:hypothetical protein [Streptomyces durbertensis]MBB1247179.1 hypothetical protein [Streptomyces durbertensis]
MTDDEHVPAVLSLARELGGMGEAGAAARGALASAVSLASNGEPDSAVDDLCHIIAAFRITLDDGQRAELARLARALGVDDLIDENSNPTPSYPDHAQVTPEHGPPQN